MTQPVLFVSHIAASAWMLLGWIGVDPSATVSVSRTPTFSSGKAIELPPGTVAYTDQNATTTGTYMYQVCAALIEDDGTRDSACSDSVTIGPAGIGDPKKPAPPYFNSGTVDATTVQLAFASQARMQEFQIRWNQAGVPPSISDPQVEIDSPGTNGSWTFGQLAPHTKYRFQIEGWPGGTYPWSDFSAASIVETRPLPPSISVTSTGNTNGSFNASITFTAATDATVNKIQRFRVGAHKPESEWDFGPAINGQIDLDLVPASYFYRIVSVGSDYQLTADSNKIQIPFLPVPVKHPLNFQGFPYRPLSVSSWDSSRLDLTYEGTGNGIYRLVWDVDHWIYGPAGHQFLGNWTTGVPVEIATPPFGGYVFVRGQDNNIYTKAVVGANAETDWTPLGGSAITTPAAISISSGRVDVFVVGEDLQVYQKSRMPSGAWQTEWTPLGGYALSQPVVTSSGTGRIDLFVTGPDSAVYTKTWDGAKWLPSSGGWTRLDGQIFGAPSVVSWGPGRIDLIVVGTDSNIYQRTSTDGQWSNWAALGGPALGPPALVSWGPNRLDIFIIGGDKGIYHKYWDGSQWNPSPSEWQPVGGTVYGDVNVVAMPAAVSWGAGRIDLFVMGTDRAIYQKTSVWDSWTGWAAMNGVVGTGE
jgi:hypothetical protein